jgi:hypothetical protein
MRSAAAAGWVRRWMASQALPPGGLQSEPWVFVIDRSGVIRARLGEGPTVAAEIQSALRPCSEARLRTRPDPQP